MYQGTITQLTKTHSKQMTFIMQNRQTNHNRNYYIKILIQQKENNITRFPKPDSPRIFLTNQTNPHLIHL